MDQEKQKQTKRWLGGVLDGQLKGQVSEVEYVDQTDGGLMLMFVAHDKEKSFGFTSGEVEAIADVDEAFRKKILDALLELARR